MAMKRNLKQWNIQVVFHHFTTIGNHTIFQTPVSCYPNSVWTVFNCSWFPRFVLAFQCPTDPLILPYLSLSSLCSAEHAGNRALFPPPTSTGMDVFLESQVSRHFMFPVAVVNYPMKSFIFQKNCLQSAESPQCSCESDLKTSFVTQQGLSECWSKIENLSKDYLYLVKDKKVLELFTICFLPFKLMVCLLPKSIGSLQSPKILEFSRRVLSKTQNSLHAFITSEDLYRHSFLSH